MEVSRITAGKLHTSEVVNVHIVEVSIDMVAQSVVVVGIHNVPHPALHVVTIDIAPGYRHRIHCYDTCRMLLFVAKRMWQTECYVDIALSLQTLRDTVVSCCQSSKYVRRILPSEH